MRGVIERLKRFSLIKKVLYSLIGLLSYPGLVWFNKLKIEGTEHLKGLPKKNVLFVSNHQTYFADVITFLHIFAAIKWGKKNRLGFPIQFLNPFTNVNFVAAEETMKASLVSKIFALAGAITIKRTWRTGGENVQRSLDPNDTKKIHKALDHNWVITFPQGTTKPFAPGRKGTAFIIKENRPIVIPVVIQGFWRAFNRKGLKFKKRGTRLSVKFKEPLKIDYSETPEIILEQVMCAIEQSRAYMMKGRHHQDLQQI